MRLCSFMLVFTLVPSCDCLAQSAFPGKTAPLQSIETLGSAPNLGKMASELLEFRDKAAAIFVDSESTQQERETAAELRDRSNRQIEIAATLERDGTRIVNGRKADFASFQYQVALVFTGYPSAFDGQFCGGSLINQDWVVTAAHCLRSSTRPGDIQIYAGSAKLSNGGKLINVKSIIRHEQYDSQTNNNDIALLQLADHVSQQPIGVVGSTKETSLFNVTHNATISGWGDTHEGARTGSDDLLYATTQLVIPPDTCIKSYKTVGRTIFTNNMLCAGGGSPAVDACQGDSGGPLILHDNDGKAWLEGIVSWGEGCARKLFPGVYTRVPSYADWIQQKTGFSP
jgi:secreted trypsin-like serine protease